MSNIKLIIWAVHIVALGIALYWSEKPQNAGEWGPVIGGSLLLGSILYAIMLFIISKTAGLSETWGTTELAFCIVPAAVYLLIAVVAAVMRRRDKQRRV